MPRKTMAWMVLVATLGFACDSGDGDDGSASSGGDGNLDSCTAITRDEAASIIGAPIVEVDPEIMSCFFATRAGDHFDAVEVRLDISASYCITPPTSGDTEILDAATKTYVNDNSAQICKGDQVVTISVRAPFGNSYKAGLRTVALALQDRL